MTISSVNTGAIGDRLLAGNPSFVPTSFESIASASGTGSSGTITFSSIPSTYKSLQIRIFAQSNAGTAARSLYIQTNNDTGSNYVRHDLTGDGSAVEASG